MAKPRKADSNIRHHGPADGRPFAADYLSDIQSSASDERSEPGLDRRKDDNQLQAVHGSVH